MSSKKHFQQAFTIVELLVVITVIGIIAAIPYLAYNGIQDNARKTTVMSDLDNATSILELSLKQNGSYPASVAVADNGNPLPASPGTTYQYAFNNTNTPKTFCLTAAISNQRYFITQEGTPLPGPCPVLYLDASISTSYPGSGATWTDLSGNGNNATMYGSVPFETDVVPNFNFSTVTGDNAYNASLGFTFTSNMITTTGDFTFSTWIKNPPSLTQIGLFSNAGSGDGYRFGVGLTGVYFLIGPSYTETNINFLSPILSNTWNNVVAVYARSAARVSVYLNGVFQNSANMPLPQTTMGNTTPGIVRSSCCTLYTGKISSFSAYNTTLSSAEINQYFNALRTRFGV